MVQALVVLLGLMGCGPSGPEPRGGPDFSQVDSAGILVSITRDGLAHSPLGWTVDPEPDLVLGRGGSPSDYFHRVQGMRGTIDGGVLVVDGGSQELRFHDSEGRLVKRAGGPGQGPGEFRDPVLVPVVGVDSLLIFDKRLAWAQVLTAEGEYGRQIRHVHGRPYGGRAPLGAVGFRYMLFNGSGTAGGPEQSSPDNGMVQFTQQFMWYDTATGGLLTVDSVLVNGRYHDQPWSWVVPFAAHSSAATTATGVFVTRGRPAEIFEYDVDGRLQRILRIEESGRPVTQELIDAFIDFERSSRPIAYAELSRSSWYRAYQVMGIPDTLPAFQALQVDELGWLWAEVYDFDPSRPRDWVVLDPEGRARGTVSTPPGLEIQWIGRDAVVGVWRDEFEVEYVHRHRLTRGELPEDSSGI